jgi:hypothetical protein
MIFRFPRPPSRVFSKRFLRQMPDGRPQVQQVERNAQNTKALRQAQGERFDLLQINSILRNKYAGEPIK